MFRAVCYKGWIKVRTDDNFLKALLKNVKAVRHKLNVNHLMKLFITYRRDLVLEA